MSSSVSSQSKSTAAYPVGAVVPHTEKGTEPIPPNPSELLDSQKMIDYIEELKKNYDIILLDSPPLIAVTDAYILRKYADQFLLVVRASVTLKGALLRVVSAFKQSDLHINGVVMNAVSEQHSYGSGYYYNYYQYYYGDTEK